MARATSEVVRLANGRAGEGFVAVSADARKKFWLDRKRTAAISKHTNAFKVNEDVVIPLPRMGEYTLGIERINIELSCATSWRWWTALQALFAAAGNRLPLGKSDDAGEIPSAELLEDRVQQAHGRCLREVGAVSWRDWLDGSSSIPAAPILRWPAGRTNCGHRGRRRSCKPLQEIFSRGRAFKPLLEECQPHPQGSAARPRLGGFAHARR